MCVLGMAHARGMWGLSPSATIAVYWYSQGAAAGLAEAQFRLGVLYEHGQGVGQDKFMAAEWYAEAAAQGHVDAAFAAAAEEGFNSSVDRLRREDDDSLPTVSIIVPVHNAVNWLDECLASVLTQRLTYRGPIQVSVYDDASTAGIVYSHTHNTHCTFH